MKFVTQSGQNPTIIRFRKISDTPTKNNESIDICTMLHREKFQFTSSIRNIWLRAERLNRELVRIQLDKYRLAFA